MIISLGTYQYWKQLKSPKFTVHCASIGDLTHWTICYCPEWFVICHLLFVICCLLLEIIATGYMAWYTSIAKLQALSCPGGEIWDISRIKMNSDKQHAKIVHLDIPHSFFVSKISMLPHRNRRQVFLLWDFFSSSWELLLVASSNSSTDDYSLFAIATMISSFYTILLAFFRPYRPSDDLYLALITNVLLTTCFAMGSFLIDNDSYEALLLVVIFVFSVLIISLALPHASYWWWYTPLLLTLRSDFPNQVRNQTLN